MPNPIASGANPRQGTCKRVTHQNEDYLGLTTRESSNNLNDPAFNTFNQEMLRFIFDKELKFVIPQFRINQTQFITRNLGNKDLHHTELAISFSLRSFRNVAIELGILHKNELVHRDIKPSNMILFKGDVYLFDLDSMLKKGTSKEKRNMTTTAYLHPSLRGGFYNKLGFKIDQYCFIASIISVCNKRVTYKSGCYSETEIDNYLQRTSFGVRSPKAQELRNFLADPIENSLSRELVEYL